MGLDPLDSASEILQNRFYYSAFSNDPRSPNSNIANYTTITTEDRESGETISVKRRVHYFSIDTELVYWNFFLDFGPLNLGQLYRFCQKLKSKLEDSRFKNRVLCFYSNTSFDKRANAIFLVCAWQVIYLKRTPEESCRPFMDLILPDYYAEQRQSGRQNNLHGKSQLDPLPPFHDASPSECNYDLTILDCIKGLAKALHYDFFNFNDFPITEYEHFEQVEVCMLSFHYDRIYAHNTPSMGYMLISYATTPFITHNLTIFISEWGLNLDNAQQNYCICWASE